MFCITATFNGDKTHGTRCVFGVPPTRRGHSKTSWSGHGPDTRTLLRLSAARELSGCFDVREGQRQRRFNRWLRSLRDHNHLAKCGVVTARQGFAGAANAPLTGFTPKGRSHWSLASPSLPFEHGNDSALYITVNVNQRFAYECCIAFAGVVTFQTSWGLAHRRRRCR